MASNNQSNIELQKDYKQGCFKIQGKEIANKG